MSIISHAALSSTEDQEEDPRIVFAQRVTDSLRTALREGRDAPTVILVGSKQYLQDALRCLVLHLACVFRCRDDGCFPR